MTRRLSSVVAAVVLISATALAQGGKYDPATEQTISGTIRYVISAASPDGTVGVHLELKTDTGPAFVSLGPALFIGNNNFWFLSDDKVELTGAKVGAGRDAAIWVRAVKKDGKTLMLRDADGTPRWPRATDDDPDGCGVSHGPIR